MNSYFNGNTINDKFVSGNTFLGGWQFVAMDGAIVRVISINIAIVI